MSLVRLLTKLAKPADLIVFFVSVFIGLFVASLLPPGAWANYGFILVSYHLFLVWLVVDSDKRASISLSIISTILTHAACLVLIIAIATGGGHIPFFGLLRTGVVVMAIFERDWLFSGGKKKIKIEPIVTAEAAAATDDVSGEDYEAWIQHLSHRSAASRKPGTSVRDEYAQFMIARAKKKAAAASESSPA